MPCLTSPYTTWCSSTERAAGKCIKNEGWEGDGNHVTEVGENLNILCALGTN
jgi:hypothetical protein